MKSMMIPITTEIMRMTIATMRKMTGNLRVLILQAHLMAIMSMTQDIATVIMSMTADMTTDMTTKNTAVDIRQLKRVHADPERQERVRAR